MSVATPEMVSAHDQTMIFLTHSSAAVPPPIRRDVAKPSGAARRMMDGSMRCWMKNIRVRVQKSPKNAHAAFIDIAPTYA